MDADRRDVVQVGPIAQRWVRGYLSKKFPSLQAFWVLCAVACTQRLGPILYGLVGQQCFQARLSAKATCFLTDLSRAWHGQASRLWGSLRGPRKTFRCAFAD
jgi:hypothetical protein